MMKEEKEEKKHTHTQHAPENKRKNAFQDNGGGVVVLYIFYITLQANKYSQ